ncbi:MAG TPA: GGDEF domain-containing protein [Syntrophomonadaceae bacterium]|nr:GGDEF domain-containing protein [Syntrophomonadaceae bacterium]
MFISKFFHHPINEKYQKEFSQETTLLNINRGRLFASTTLMIEIILFLANGYFSDKPVSTSHNFQYFNYGLMYLLLILASLLYLVVFSQARKKIIKKQPSITGVDWLMVSYISLVMTWSAGISLMDQRLYGNVAAYLATIVLCPLIFYLKSSLLSIPYIVSLTVLMVGLPYFQPSRSVLIGHYVNIGIFVVLSWVMARSQYCNYLISFISHRKIDARNQLLHDINDQLTGEIVLRKNVQEELEKANQELKKLSLIDDLTGIPNRRSLDNFLDREWNRAIREGNSLALLMIDIDNFKAFNDHYGHLSGDKCLIQVAQTLNSHCRRSSDFVARLGGEEFLFVAVNMDQEGTESLAEQIRDSIENLNIPHAYSESAPYLTISIGVSICSPSIADSPEEGINKADRALYRAKLAGRNRVAS